MLFSTTQASFSCTYHGHSSSLPLSLVKVTVWKQAVCWPAALLNNQNVRINCNTWMPVKMMIKLTEQWRNFENNETNYENIDFISKAMELEFVSFFSKHRKIMITRLDLLILHDAALQASMRVSATSAKTCQWKPGASRPRLAMLLVTGVHWTSAKLSPMIAYFCLLIFLNDRQ